MVVGGRLVTGAPDGADRLRRLAGRGELGRLTPQERHQLVGAAYATVYPIVFNVVTRRVEHGRGHPWCARGVPHLAAECLDSFYDDVEAMIERLLTAKTPIADLEAWVARCASNAAVDAYRKRRAGRGALQRPRMTRAIAAGLPDPWLQALALKILEWVGLPAGVGAHVWPLDAWAQERAAATGDQRGSTPAQVATDVARVLAVLRGQPTWYAEHVERPLGLKTTPTAGAPGDGPRDPRPLEPADPHDVDRARITGLASIALEAIAGALRRGDDPYAVVVKVLGTLFVGGTGAEEIDRVPTTGELAPDERVSALLGDVVALPGVVERVMRIIGEGLE